MTRSQLAGKRVNSQTARLPDLAAGRNTTKLLGRNVVAFQPKHYTYGSQGKTVDHVLMGDASSKGATNAQQWYVSISRGRKSVKIFTADKEQLRANIVRSGARALALDMKPPRNRHEAMRSILLRGARRGRVFARAISMAFATKRRRTFHTIKPTIKP